MIVMMFALAGQGIVPGLVLCRGEEGHVAVEAAFDLCCASSLQATAQARSAISLEAADPSAHGCGPCSDTPILANPLRLPTHERDINLGQTRRATIIDEPATNGAKTTVNTWLVHPATALIPITTSVLLI